MACSFEKLKDMDLTRDELDRIGTALKDEQFRKLLVEYVEELKDPENKKLYEKEMTELEKERGVDVTFINPAPGYVIKTSVNGSKKAFVNVCANEHIRKPSSTPTTQDGSKGLEWSLPHSISPPREDVDNKNVRCQVYDVVFHPDTIHLAHNSKSFRGIVTNTACEAIESNYDVTLDRNNLKFPKIQYKGMPYATVIRKLSKDKPAALDPEEQAIMDKLYDSMPKVEDKSPQLVNIKVDKTKETYTSPKYIIKHRSHVELEEFTEHKSAKLNSAIPKELVIDINLPLLKSATDIVLDVTEKTVQLISEKPAKYKLSLTLPYNVVQDNGNAKFDKDLKKLTVTLPVRRSKVMFSDSYHDSGVESDHGSPTTSSPVENIDKLITELNNYSELDSDFRTKVSFLEPDEHFVLPEHSCHVFESTVAFTLQVKNVDESSLQKVSTSNSIHIKFSTVSSGFFPTYYAFYLNLPEHAIVTDEIEVWDNNVVVQLTYKPCNATLRSYFVGINEEGAAEKYVEEPSIVNNILENSMNAIETVKDQDDDADVENAEQDDANKINDIYKTNDIDKIKGRSKTKKIVREEPLENEKVASKAIDIIGAFSESSSDELSCSYSPSKCKGILKRFSTSRSPVSRSISESSIDEVLWASSFENCYTSLDSVIPEDGEVSASLKKTVRFNDVVSKQMYRSNSSILGQKKKNQRKARNKKRAQERRHSESELSEFEDKKEGDLKTGLMEVEESAPNNKPSNEKKNDASDIFDLDI